MKKYLTLLLAIALILFSFVGCSDMMEKLGKISLTIALDTPDIDVATFSLEGTLSNSSTRVVWPDIATPKHTLSALKSGTWSLTVTAFDDDGEQLGVGTQQVHLKEGQIVETTLLVVFTQADPLPGVFTSSSPSRFDSSDGEVMGTTSAMEYKLASSPEDAPYTACTEGTTILGAGIYLVRYAAAHGLHASEPISVTVPDYQPIQLTIGDPTLTTSKIYDGTTGVSGTVTLGALGGVRESDTVTISAQTTYDNKSAGSGKTITVAYTLGGPDADNYIKPVDKAVMGVIEKRQLTITETSIATSKVYDRATSSAVISHGTLSGIVTGDTVTVTASAAYNDNSAGTDKTITVSYALGDTDAGNYLKPIDDPSFIGEITKKPLTVSGTEPTLAKQYDGTTSVQLQNGGNLIGVVSGDTVTLQATASYGDTSVGSEKLITVNYTISGDTANYQVPEAVAFDSGRITRKQLTVSNLALTSNKVYDGTTSVSNPSFSFDGKVLGEDVQVTATATYDSPSAEIGKQITVVYALEGDDKDNYLKPVDPAATFAGVITKKQLTVSGTALALNKVYDRTDTAAITTSGTLQGVLAGDTVSFSAVATYDSITAGENKSVTVVYSLTGDETDNYFKPANDVHTGAIQKRQLQVTTLPTVATTKTYDRTLGAEITQQSTLSGVIPGDSVTLVTSAAYVAKHAGTEKPIWIYYNIDGADKNNYLKPADTLATEHGIITKKQLTVSGTTITADKVYDGTTSVAVKSHGILAGIVVGDTVSMQATATYDTKAVGTDKPITLTYTLIGTDKDNYYKPDDWIATQEGVITPKQLGIQILDLPSTKVYDGTTSATAPTFNLFGKLSSDNVAVTATATYETPEAGTGKRIAITYSLTGTDKDNYIKPNDLLTTPSCAIIKKQLTISAPTLESVTKTYDGTTAVLGTVTPGSLSGVLEGDDVTVGATANHGSANVTYTINGLFNQITVKYTLDGTNAGNYAPPNWDFRWGAIEPKQLSVIDTLFPASKVYDKTSAITITSPGTLSGVLEGDDVILTNVVAYYSGTYNANVGTDKAVTINYTIDGEDKYNYSLDSDTSRKASITPALLTATVGDYTRTYGENPPNFEVDVSGFVGSDSATNTAGYTSPTASAGTNSSSAAGTYTIAISGGSATNYIFDLSDTGTLTIQKPAGPAISGTIAGYFPNSNESQMIINVTGFTPDQTGIEAQIAYYGIFNLYYSDLVIDSRGRAVLYMPTAATTATKIRFRVKETSSHAPGAATEIALVARPLAIGDYYEGGIVAYISTSSTLAEETHGLIAAKSDISPVGIVWSNIQSTQIGTANYIGSGLTNTNSIVSRLGASASYYAAGKARFYTGGGNNDWFLPSKDELIELCRNRLAIGNFITTSESFYWSSSENDNIRIPADSNNVWAVNFDSSSSYISSYASIQTNALHVRPVRYF